MNDTPTTIPNDISIDEIRQTANHHFSKREYDSALPLYELAVSMAKQQNRSDKVVHYCNLSACYFQMDRFDESRDAALEAVDVSHSTNAKAYFRLARSQIGLEQYKLAISTIDTAMKTLPKETTTETQFRELKQLQDLARKKSSQPPTKKKPSVLDYTLHQKQILGEGNFSKIIKCSLKSDPSSTYAIKIIAKTKAAELAKRQHPNVYNEIQMERRVLKERLPPNPHIVPLLATFQDYNNVYYVMEFLSHGDLWSRLFFEKKMVGCHFTVIPRYVRQLLQAVEHCHMHGIVHRDIKTENIMFDSRDQLVLCDFGTAKDLVETDLNGPEFVGTPDFMAPEMVSTTEFPEGAGCEADLWSLGCVMFQMYLGYPPFESSSSYLGFLRIQNGFVFRDRPMWGMGGDEIAWDLIGSLLRVDPKERLGAGAFAENGAKSYNDTTWKHPYFNLKNETNVPSLRDFCIRSSILQLQHDSLQFEIPGYEPGDNSPHDFLRCKPNDKERIMYIANKMGILSPPRVYRRFCSDKVQARLDKIHGHQYIGLSWAVDHAMIMDLMQHQHNMTEVWIPLKLVYVVQPFLLLEGDHATDMNSLKTVLRQVNRERPKAVIITGTSSLLSQPSNRKLLAKINESIPVVLNSGTQFFQFWMGGAQFLVLSSQLSTDDEERRWLFQEMELTNTSRHLVFVFINGDARELEPSLLDKLAWGKVTAVLGSSSKEDWYRQEYEYIHKDSKTNKGSGDESDNEGVDDHVMLLMGGRNSSKDILLVDSEGSYSMKDFMK